MSLQSLGSSQKNPGLGCAGLKLDERRTRGRQMVPPTTDLHFFRPFLRSAALPTTYNGLGDLPSLWEQHAGLAAGQEADPGRAF